MKFCGLTVHGVQSSISTNGSGGDLRVSMVLDASDGDSPDFPDSGTPIYFTFGDFSYSGLLRQYSEQVSITGNPTYECLCVDPSEILEAAIVITEGYAGPAYVNNVLNVFGYYEDLLGYGGSGHNSAGMEWVKIELAVLGHCNGSITSDYGAPIEYRGITYGLDLSELPAVPAGYRINGNGNSLLQIISQVCKDVGVDYFFQLDGTTIVLRTLIRGVQPTLGAMATFIASMDGLVSAYDLGVESADDVTTRVLVGGNQSVLYAGTVVHSYWGDDLDGLPIVGVSGAHDDLIGVPCEFFTVPCLEIADIIGILEYPCNTVEIRCALASEDLWLSYIQKYRPGIAALLGAALKPPAVNAQKKGDLVNEARAEVLKMLDADIQMNSHMVYHFVRKYAEEYYGKRFLVKVPDVAVKIPDGDTLIAEYSHEPDQAGWLPDWGAVFSLDVIEQQKFEERDGRVMPFAIISDVHLLDAAGLDPTRMAIANGGVYAHCDIAPRLVVLPATNLAYAKVTLSEPLFQRKTFGPGGEDIVINFFGDKIQKNQAGGTIGGLSTYPLAHYPTTIVVALRDNRAVYGPWVSSGAAGKVEYEQDQSLVPWNFGSEAALDIAGFARVSSGNSYQTHQESGSVTVAGLPAASLGDALISGGPNVTHLNIRYGIDGFKTQYQFFVFAPRGREAFQRQAVENIRKTALLSREAKRKATRNLARELLVRDAAAGANRIRAFRKNLPKWLAKESPHETIMARAYEDEGRVHVMASSTTIEEALALSNADDDAEFRNTAYISASALFRPAVATQPTGDPDTLFARYRLVEPGTFGGGNATPVTSQSLFPYRGSYDTQCMSWGNQYDGLRTEDNEPPPEDMRIVTLPAPLILTGWGYALDGSATHSTGAQVGINSTLGKSGPIDPLWDETRGVWTVHDVLSGLSVGAIPTGGYGEILIGGESGYSVTAFNYGVSTVPTGGSVRIAYIANTNSWEVIPAGGPFWRGGSTGTSIISTGTGGECDCEPYIFTTANTTGAPTGSTGSETTNEILANELSGLRFHGDPQSRQLVALEASNEQQGVVTITDQQFAGWKTTNPGWKFAGSTGGNSYDGTFGFDSGSAISSLYWADGGGASAAIQYAGSSIASVSASVADGSSYEVAGVYTEATAGGSNIASVQLKSGLAGGATTNATIKKVGDEEFLRVHVTDGILLDPATGDNVKYGLIRAATPMWGIDFVPYVTGNNLVLPTFLGGIAVGTVSVLLPCCDSTGSSSDTTGSSSDTTGSSSDTTGSSSDTTGAYDVNYCLDSFYDLSGSYPTWGGHPDFYLYNTGGTEWTLDYDGDIFYVTGWNGSGTISFTSPGTGGPHSVTAGLCSI